MLPPEKQVFKKISSRAEGQALTVLLPLQNRQAEVVRPDAPLEDRIPIQQQVLRCHGGAHSFWVLGQDEVYRVFGGCVLHDTSESGEPG